LAESVKQIGSFRQVSVELLIRWCCIDRLNRHDLSGVDKNYLRLWRWGRL